ncbi:hypothetical protein B9Z19DRAFT_1066372 [Tuber borchii]|uniref:Uncharacterized protein n=1 Tax=Tuber borchii TaxID=42251 RepID=A0A2T6ZMZ4_TUBBO|nr:hypothetical protein B9Z19DRAFT_1066372 [Tuber borchii]
MSNGNNTYDFVEDGRPCRRKRILDSLLTLFQGDAKTKGVVGRLPYEPFLALPNLPYLHHLLPPANRFSPLSNSPNRCSLVGGPVSFPISILFKKGSIKRSSAIGGTLMIGLLTDFALLRSATCATTAFLYSHGFTKNASASRYFAGALTKDLAHEGILDKDTREDRVQPENEEVSAERWYTVVAVIGALCSMVSRRTSGGYCHTAGRQTQLHSSQDNYDKSGNLPVILCHSDGAELSLPGLLLPKKFVHNPVSIPGF